MSKDNLSDEGQDLLNMVLNFEPDELELFKTIQALMDDNLTGSVTFHLSEGKVRKVETTEVQRFAH